MVNTVITKIDASITSVTLLVANDNRRMATIYNNSTSALCIKYGEEASLTSFSLKINSGDYLELPPPCYTGNIDAFWEVADGNAMITEITPCL
jgi:hypothetical protein